MKNKKSLFAVSAVLLLISIGGGFFYYLSSEKHKQADQKTQSAMTAYGKTLAPEANFYVQSQEFRKLLVESSELLSFDNRCKLKTFFADSMSGFGRDEAVGLLKEVILDTNCSARLRVMAVNFLINDHDFEPDYDLAKNRTFTGNVFAGFIADNDFELAFRRLNEWTIELFPNMLSHYRIARWYAWEIEKKPEMTKIKEDEYMAAVDKHLSYGDLLFDRRVNTLDNKNKGHVFEIKATIFYALNDLDRAEEFFKKALEAYNVPPITVFQRTYYKRAKSFYAAFLARNYGETRAKEVRNMLEPTFELDFLNSSLKPNFRDPRRVQLFIMARDSQQPYFPYPNFNRTDIESFYKIYPESRAVIEGLNYAEYAKDVANPNATSL